LPPYLDDNLEKEFRDEVFRKFYLTENGMSEAIEEAIKDWMKKSKNEVSAYTGQK
jgi:hypothetical protein